MKDARYRESNWQIWAIITMFVDLNRIHKMQTKVGKGIYQIFNLITLQMDRGAAVGWREKEDPSKSGKEASLHIYKFVLNDGMWDCI
jgi:hypothetical protein